MINFEELQELTAIKNLNDGVKDFLALFTETDALDFKNQLSKYKDLMAKEGLDEKKVILKKTYVQIC